VSVENGFEELGEDFGVVLSVLWVDFVDPVLLEVAQALLDCKLVARVVGVQLEALHLGLQFEILYRLLYHYYFKPVRQQGQAVLRLLQLHQQRGY